MELPIFCSSFTLCIFTFFTLITKLLYMFPEKLDNVAIGQNIAKFRRLKELKALDVAEQLGLKESAYTKYERGETAITIDFIQRIADILEISPFNILM
ncbi:MAG: XRE family transcriptional regulator, partial [Chitinophagia bacterium]|nr:XRE family transcriptional regulator [Chitinophagia bacterium]